MSAKIENKLGGRQASTGLGAIMSPGVIAALVLISLFAFGALITLSGFAGDIRKTSNGRAHALSESAIGFAGIVELLRSEGMDVKLSREELGEGSTNVLKIITLSSPYQLPKQEDLSADIVTLIILPKWYVYPMQGREGWVRQAQEPVGPTFKPDAFNAPLAEFSDGLKVTQVTQDDGTLVYDLSGNNGLLPTGEGFNIRNLQTLEGENVVSILSANGKTVLGLIENSRTYVLSEPDLLNTMGISQKSRARFGRDLVEGLIETESTWKREVAFDLNIHGFARTQNLIKTLLTPPFLAATLCLLAAGGLVAWQAFARFGDAAREERDYELGKYTLADNGARFIRIAGKETGMADGYNDLMRRQAAKDFYMDKQSQESIDAFFKSREDKLGMTSRWQTLSRQLRSASTKTDFLHVAKTIHKWRQEITHERK